MNPPRSIEAEGGTVDEAVASALISLGADRADVDIEVLTNPSRGLFGLGVRAARVRVSRHPAAPAPNHPPTSTEPDASASGGSEVRRGRAALSAPLDETLLETARAVLADLIQRMGFAAEIEVERGEENPLLQIRGGNTNVMIGKHGQTLDALEYVLNRIVSRDEETGSRIHIDCEDYRAKRRRALEEMARRMGEQARRRGRSVTLDPLSPRDRRTVHLALQHEPEITTRSTGEGFYRQVMIIPQGRGPSRPRQH